MKTSRWDKAGNPNTGGPAPVLVYPNAYDINLRIERTKPFPNILIGPIRSNKPANLVPYNDYVIHWTAQVISIIDNKATVSKYLVTKPGARLITIDWRRNGQILATTFYNITI